MYRIACSTVGWSWPQSKPSINGSIFGMSSPQDVKNDAIFTPVGDSRTDVVLSELTSEYPLCSSIPVQSLSPSTNAPACCPSPRRGTTQQRWNGLDGNSGSSGSSTGAWTREIRPKSPSRCLAHGALLSAGIDSVWHCLLKLHASRADARAASVASVWSARPARRALGHGGTCRATREELQHDSGAVLVELPDHDYRASRSGIMLGRWTMTTSTMRSSRRISAARRAGCFSGSGLSLSS